MDSGRKPILFVSFPEAGLINTLLVIAGEMARRGVEDLWFATDDPAREEVEALSAASEVRFASLGAVVPEFSAKNWDDKIYRKVTQRSRFRAHRALVRHNFDLRLRIGKFRALDALVEEVKPALMVIDSVSMHAVEVAIMRKIPFVVSLPFMPSTLFPMKLPMSFPMLHTGLPLNMNLWQRIYNFYFKSRAGLMFLHPTVYRTLRKSIPERRALKIPPETFYPSVKVDYAELVLCFSVFGLEYEFPVPDKVKMVGAIIPPLPEAPRDEDLFGWLDANDSVVFMALGTLTRLTRKQVHAMVEVARRLEGHHQVLWKLPREQQKLLPPSSELPGNLRVEHWLPSQLDVLAHKNVAAFFTHAGGNSFHEGLYFGKPLIHRPLWLDNYDQSIRGVDAGVGLTLDRPDTLLVKDTFDKITRVLSDPSFRERAEHFGKVLQEEAGGLHASVDLILGCDALKRELVSQEPSAQTN
ncbi:MAG TPA: glycosyltransferase [Pseudonocardiaceae bacterium]|nr:glycosyltransferase [Pseudonocardiaceae bacterium]